MGVLGNILSRFSVLRDLSAVVLYWMGAWHISEWK